MGQSAMAGAAVVREEDCRAATKKAIEQAVAPLGAAKPDLAVVFASAAFADDYPRMLADIRAGTGAGLVVGCSGQGVIGPRREVEGEPALALLLAALPGATLRPYHFTQEEVEESSGPVFWHIETEIEPPAARAWLLLADPYHLQGD